MKLLKPKLLMIAFLTHSCEKDPGQSALNKQEPATEVGTTPGLLTQSMATQGELEIKDLKQGKGEEAKQNQILRVNYKAFFESGTLFDSSEKRGQAFTFTLGEGTVIKGWELGLKGMKVGTLRKLTIPPHLAYGEKGISGVIPPGSTLIFEVELLAVKGP